MLDAFEIITTSGVVIWRKHFLPISSSVINNLINDVFIEERVVEDIDEIQNTASAYKKGQHTLKWMRVKDPGVIFVAVYQSLLRISWVDDLLFAARALFLKLYAVDLRNPHLTRIRYTDFDQTFDALLAKLDIGSLGTDANADDDAPPQKTNAEEEIEGKLAEEPPLLPTPNTRAFRIAHANQSLNLTKNGFTSLDSSPGITPDTSKPTTPLQGDSHVLTVRSGPTKLSRKAKKALISSVVVSSGDESTLRTKSVKGGGKQKRKWDIDGTTIEGDDDTILDYSAPVIDADREADLQDIDPTEMGSRTGKGQFVLKDLDDEVDAILASSRSLTSSSTTSSIRDSGLIGSATSKLTGMFRNVVGGKMLSREDLRLPLQHMRTHLLEKNVAREAADRLCTSVEADLLAQKTASFTSTEKTIHESMSKALTRILTPTSSLDLLRNITETISGHSARPYVISIVGVNGVGKSTSLSKIAYFLLQNNFRVLVVAADTFRSGAVEQLRVHVRNLSELSKRESVGSVELFERGYGKDAAAVARDAVAFATNAGKGSILYDVVLIDTAGRRHNDTRLMSSLTKFGQLANPDKVFMVGEALVGTDSVAQARNFAKEFVDSKGRMRNDGIGMDGFIISKCDTVGDMVGTLVSMVHATRIPVVFLGVGQHYGDLRGLNVGWAVDKLMR